MSACRRTAVGHQGPRNQACVVCHDLLHLRRCRILFLPLSGEGASGAVSSGQPLRLSGVRLGLKEYGVLVGRERAAG